MPQYTWKLNFSFVNYETLTRNRHAEGKQIPSIVL